MSQRARLMLTLAAAMLPLVLLALGLLWRDAQAVEERISGDRVALAQAGSMTVTAFLDGNLRALQVAAAELGGADPAELEQLGPGLQRFLEPNPLWVGLGIHDGQGILRVGTTPAEGDISIADRPYFRQVMATGLPTVSSAVVGRATNVAVVVLAVPLPLANGERAVLVAPMELADLSAALLGVLGQEEIRVTVADSAGQTVVHPNPERVAGLMSLAERPEVVAARRGETGTLVADRGGEEMLVAYAPVPAFGWTVMVAERTSVAFAPSRELLFQGIGLLGLTLIAVLGIGWVLGGLVSDSYASEQQARLDADAHRRSAEESQQRYADLVDGLDGVVWEARADDLSFTFMSPAAEAILGFPLDHWLSGPARWGDHMHPDDGPFVTEHCLHDLRTADDHACEYRAVRADGEVIWLADMVRASRDVRGGVRLLRGIMIDVTARHEAEEERARLFAAERHARAEAEAAVRSRDEFLSIASHELRNPVAAIKGTGQLVQRLSERQSLTPAAQREYLETIVRTSDRLGRLVEDLLDVSRLRGDQFRLRLEHADLSAIVRAAASSDVLAGREVRIFGADAPRIATVDPDRVHQILQNLLENAAKYSPPGEPIDLAVRSKDGTLEVAVTDYGIGLPPESAHALFTPFGRAPNAVAANIPGMGLGLYISRRLAEAHGGSLAVHSQGEGTGSTFLLALPASSGQAHNQEVGVLGGVGV